jgi:hypothetical protein
MSTTESLYRGNGQAASGREWSTPHVEDITDQLKQAQAKPKQNGSASAARQNAALQIEQLNYKHFMITTGKCVVGEFVVSPIDPNAKVLSFQRPADFATRYANCFIVEIKNGKTTHRELGRYWLRHPRRRSYEGIGLDPKGPKVLPGNRLNLWRGFGVKPKRGEYPMLRAHIKDVLANGDELAKTYIWNWGAWAVQNPDKQAETALVLQGEKGSGKGTWAHIIRRGFGPHGLHIYSPSHLTGQFNGHLEGCLYLFSDEAFAVTDHRAESTLKSLITEPTLMIERKNIDAYPIKNMLHIMMCANADWIVPASAKERRYAVFQVNPARVGDKPYFKALHAEINNGGLEAVFYDLLHTDLGDWHPRQVYETEALQRQKRRSLDPGLQWLEGLLQDGQTPASGSTSFLLEEARRLVPQLRKMNVTTFGTFLNEWGIPKQRSKQSRGRKFPPLAEMRQRWESRFGKWAWEEDLKDWTE